MEVVVPLRKATFNRLENRAGLQTYRSTSAMEPEVDRFSNQRPFMGDAAQATTQDGHIGYKKQASSTLALDKNFLDTPQYCHKSGDKAAEIGRHMNEPASNESETSDEEHLHRFLTSRDMASFECLVNRYQRFAFRVSYCFCGNGTIAEDASQNAFIQLAKSYGRVSPDKVPVFKIWFYSVIVNSTKSVMRTERRVDRKKRTYKEKTSGYEVPREMPEKEYSVAQEEVRTALQNALGSLSDEDRIPLVLHYLEGVKQVDIGKLIGLSQSQTSRKITHGLELLRKRLTAMGIAIPAAGIANLMQDQHILPLPAHYAPAQEALKCIPNAATSGVPVAMTPKLSSPLVWGIALSMAIVSTGSYYFILAAKKGEALPTVASTSKSKPPDTFKRVYVKEAWNCATPGSVTGIEIESGTWTFSAGSGPSGKGCMETDKAITKLIFKVPHAASPLKFTFRSMPVDTEAGFGVYWNKYTGWGRALFRNLATPESKTDWRTHICYISESHIDSWEENIRTSFCFNSPSTTDELVLCVIGKMKLANITVESIENTDLPDFTPFKKLFEQVASDRTIRIVPISSIPGAGSSWNAKATIEFSGPISLSSWGKLNATDER